MKTIGTILLALFLVCNLTIAQDTLYVYKSGAVISKRAVIEIDSVTFSKNYKTPNPETVTDIDGNVYHTVKIGTQTWMLENLKTTKYRNGEIITNETRGFMYWTGIGGKWCDYGNSSVYATKFGHLYNGYAIRDTRNIAPTGWHIPTQAEWTTLQNYLIANGYNYDSTTTSNKIAKSLAAGTNWFTFSDIGSVGYDLNKNNSSGFTALPSGIRYITTDNSNGFTLQGSDCYFWTSTTSAAMYDNRNYITRISYEINYLGDGLVSWEYGCSVRCIKD